MLLMKAALQKVFGGWQWWSNNGMHSEGKASPCGVWSASGGDDSHIRGTDSACRRCRLLPLGLQCMLSWACNVGVGEREGVCVFVSVNAASTIVLITQHHRSRSSGLCCWYGPSFLWNSKFKWELFRFGLFDVHLGVFLVTLSYEACIDNYKCIHYNACIMPYIHKKQ